MATRIHNLSVLVENKAGVLSRIAGLFTRRGYNIDSLVVAPTEDPRFSRMTIVVNVEEAMLDQVVKQLDKLINVIEIVDFAPGDSVERELLLASVRAEPEVRGQIVDLVGIFDARILNVGHDQVTVSLDGQPSKLDDFEDLLRPYGIVTIQRTGRVALPKLARTVDAPTVLRAVGG
jgi:acetolactate synthase I/III small subunit